jgi:hypothetical protein
MASYSLDLAAFIALEKKPIPSESAKFSENKGLMVLGLKTSERLS